MERIPQDANEKAPGFDAGIACATDAIPREKQELAAHLHANYTKDAVMQVRKEAAEHNPDSQTAWWLSACSVCKEGEIDGPAFLKQMEDFKAIAADPNNIEALNLVSYDYALRRRTNQPKAEEYAQKVLTLVPTTKKPEGMTDDAFKAQQNLQEGMAHLTVGYLELEKTGASHRTAGAIKELQQATELLSANPELLGEAYYFLGYSYEALYPPNHRQAIAALEHAASSQNSMQGQARGLIAKIRSVAR